MQCYPLLWTGCGVDVFKTLHADASPNWDKVLSVLHYEHSEDPDLRTLEERVKGYFEAYIVELNKIQLARLLQFWTASDLLLARRLSVTFNSTEGFSQRPIANTCVSQLQLSRYYFSQAELKKNLEKHLNSTAAEQFDSV